MNSRSNTNLAKLQKEGKRLFDTLFVYENYPTPTESNSNILKITFKGGIEKLDYPIAVIAYDKDKELSFSLQYAGELFKDEVINKLLTTVNILLTQVSNILDTPQLNTQNLKYLSTKEEELILKTWNDTDKEYPHDKTIHSLFEDQVLKTPNNIAVIYQDIKLTYKQLNDRANQLAHYLIKHHNIKPDTLIALLLDRSENMLIAILAVLKAGAAYVPMDPQYPNDRIKYILSDTNTTLVLANNTYTKRIKKLKKVNVIPIDDNTFLKEINTYSSINTTVKELTSSNLAYVIYTSGTTGNPKGVMIEHSGVINLKYDLTKRYKFGKKEVILQLSNYVFDASVEQITLTLLNGYTLVCITQHNLLNSKKFYNYMNLYNVSHIHGTPTLLTKYNLSLFKSIKRAIYGGEKLDVNLQGIINKYPNISIINEYAPTEATITSTVKFIKNNTDISIGTPISNTKAYVLSSDLSLLPIGAVGELYIGGVGLARGYLNNPDLTAKRFISNPFQSKKEEECKKNSRIYKTGDLVRWLPDGNLEYIGRNDFQVKIRGFRIELGEIESVLSRYIGVKQAVVLTKEKEDTNNKYLIAYYTSDNGDKLDEDGILSYLATKLPEYMIPTALLHMDKLPLTLNGKLDRKALPDPILGNIDNYIAPRNELESKLCNILLMY